MKNRKKLYQQEEFTCKVCGRIHGGSWQAINCEKQHTCKCQEFSCSIEYEELHYCFYIVKKCIECNKEDAILITYADYDSIWELLSTQRLMEDINGDEN